MRFRCSYLILAVALTATGCAGQLAGPMAAGNSLRMLTAHVPAAPPLPPAGDIPRPPEEPEGALVTVGDTGTNRSIRDVATTVSPAGFQRQPLSAKERASTVEVVAQSGIVPPELEPVEEIVTPIPGPESRFKSQPAEDDFDRFSRQIVDVPVDIRPSEGAMPEDRGADKFAAEPIVDETLPSDRPADIFCSYTPWTICYRPLYFEDIALERYGKNVGYLQTGLSGVRFFGSVAALPYKMTRRPPRSCQCSNGFSRPGDCPLPGYGNRRFQWDAALVEAAVVTAFVYIIP